MNGAVVVVFNHNRIAGFLHHDRTCFTVGHMELDAFGKYTVVSRIITFNTVINKTGPALDRERNYCFRDVTAHIKSIGAKPADNRCLKIRTGA